MAEQLIINSQNNNIGRGGNYSGIQARGTRDGSIFTCDWLEALGQEGRVFFGSDADQNDALTGQTSFANTTPTLLLNVPASAVAIPLYLKLVEVGTVAGALIDVINEIDNIAAYASGGTEETVLSSRTDAPIAKLCSLYSTPTATAGYGVNIDADRLAPDVDPASADAGGPFKYEWNRGARPIYLVGPASWKIFTFAGTTGPSWTWTICWAELPASALTST